MTAGHADHFLSRLDRVNWQQMEYALALYNDAAMLAHVLAVLRLEPADERVALSLDDPKQGPFIVVTRDAKFVTCLGRGMTPTGLRVVEKSRLDAIIERKSALTEACEKAAARAGGDTVRGVQDLMRRIWVGGPGLTRDEIALLAMLAPLIGQPLTALLGDISKTAADLKEALLVKRHRRDDSRTLREHTEGARREYFRLTCATGHVFALMGEALTANPGFDDWTEEQAHGFSFGLTAGSVDEGVADVVLRACWAAARIGKPLLVPLRRAVQQPRMLGYRAFATSLGLFGIGVRSPKLREEAFKALRRKTEGQAEIMAGFRRLVGDAAAIWEQDESQAYLRTFARLTWAMAVQQVSPAQVQSNDPAVQQAVRERLAAIDDELSMAALASRYTVLLGSENEIGLLGQTVPYFVQRPLTSMYLPRSVFAERPSLRCEATPERGEQLLEAVRKHLLPSDRESDPVRVEPRPGRNDPCSCGSGKKYKRCCGV